MTPSDTTTASLQAIALALDANPQRFVDVVHRLNRLPSSPRARDYTHDEIAQMSNAFVRIVLEALRDEPPAIRRSFVDVLIPIFIDNGETSSTLIQWNTSYMLMFGAELAAVAPPELESTARDWFAQFAGIYLADVARSAVLAESAVVP